MEKPRLTVVPDKPKPRTDRLRCPKHGIVTYSMTVTLAGFQNKDGRFDKRSGRKVEVCITCLFESGGTVFTEVGR